MKIAIAGYGVEGEANYKYWAEQGHDITIADEKNTPDKSLPGGVPTILGEDAFEKLDGFDMVVRTASLPPRRIVTDGKVWSATNEFFDKCPAPIIGITGTKGKGTVAGFTASILESSGKNVHLVGNIGNPALSALGDIKEQDLVVYELSSFQLWDARKSPHVAAVLMIEPDHLDLHESFEEYVSAKGNIARWQQNSDIAIFLPGNAYSELVAGQSPGTRIPYTEAPGAHVKNGEFWVDEQKICSIKTVVIPGNHNLDNACAAITIAWQFTHDKAATGQGLSKFTGLPHRLKLVREVRGVKYYDDSIATTPGSAIAAVRAFNEPKIVILGGSSKGANFSELAKVIAESKVRKALLVGNEAPGIARALEAANFTDFEDLGSDTSMENVVIRASELAIDGDVVILSPACASFGMFKSYADRGEQFINAVETL
jgi:UDP-N-acetylmuramoylalanine--D-glutamate ligase